MIAAVVGKWLARLPRPFTPEDQAAGYRYQLSILQAEFARTQVFERPLAGRVLFEEIVKENIDLGRPEQVGFIFDRRITEKTPGRFASRIITQGVIPSPPHVGYKNSRKARPQGRPGAADRDHGQQYPGLFHRQTARQPARPQGHRL